MTIVTGGSLGFQSVGDDGSLATATIAADTTSAATFTGCYNFHGEWDSEPKCCKGMGCWYHDGWNSNLNWCRNHNEAIVSTAGLERRAEPTPVPTSPSTTAMEAAGPTPTRPHHKGCFDPSGDWHFNPRFCRMYTCQDAEGRWHRHPRQCMPYGKTLINPASSPECVGLRSLLVRPLLPVRQWWIRRWHLRRRGGGSGGLAVSRREALYWDHLHVGAADEGRGAPAGGAGGELRLRWHALPC